MGCSFFFFELFLFHFLSLSQSPRKRFFKTKDAKQCPRNTRGNDALTERWSRSLSGNFYMCVCLVSSFRLTASRASVNTAVAPANTVGHIMPLLSPFHRAFICEVDRVAIRKRQCTSRDTHHFALIRRETNRKDCLLGTILGPGIETLWGSISSAQLTFFIKPHCIIMARQLHPPLLFN